MHSEDIEALNSTDYSETALIKGQRSRKRKFSHRKHMASESIWWERGAASQFHAINFPFNEDESWAWKRKDLSTLRLIDNFYCYFIRMISFVRTTAHDTRLSRFHGTKSMANAIRSTFTCQIMRHRGPNRLRPPGKLERKFRSFHASALSIKQNEMLAGINIGNICSVNVASTKNKNGNSVSGALCTFLCSTHSLSVQKKLFFWQFS